MTQRIYLAGPITGQPDHGVAAFRDAAAQLRASGYDVVSPTEVHGFDRTGAPPCVYPDAHYARINLPILMTCECLGLLPGWRTSRGTLLEVRVARACGLQLVEVVGDELRTFNGVGLEVTL